MQPNSGRHQAAGESESGPQWAPLGLVVGLAMLTAAFSHLDAMPGWADDCGAVPIYLGFFVWMSIAGRITWWSIDTLIQHFRRRR